MESRPDTSLIDGRSLWMSRSTNEDEFSSDLAMLLTRAASGDAAAFEQIVIRHERRVLTLSWRLLGAMEDAQDAAQEVFLRTFKYLHRFDTQKPFEPWLIRMTVNVCRDMGKARSLRGAVLVEQGDSFDRSDPRDRANDPYADLQIEQQRQMLYRALDELPEKERTAFILRDIEGMTTTETAEALGSSEGTVRSQISSARLKIRKSVERMKGGWR
ncbi:MAG TPA: RNA polymerase sigma factor [Terriglobia bacterium]|nr:RNA polymerase sigma factor [Terriglobia bacterium]